SIHLLLAQRGQLQHSRGSDVLELGDSDFDRSAAMHETLLVEFFAPWCGHCQRLAPEYEAAATKLKGTLPLAKVDCTVNSETCERFGVNGYPTLKIFRNGEEAGSYDGPRIADGIVSYMKKQAGPSSVSLLSEADLDSFVDNYEASVVGVIGCDLNFSFLFGVFGLCPHLTTENRDILRGSDLLTSYYIVDYLRNLKGTNYWRNRIMKVATQFQDRGLSFAVADRQEFQDELEEEFGLGSSEGGDIPLVTIRTREGHKYSMQEEFTRDGKSLERFLEDYFAKRLKRYVKSEPVPESNDDPVKVVVADTFDEIVNDPEKDVLVEFYAPWCGHCKNLEPVYKELGEKLSGDPNIVIAKMDATANDVPPNYDVQGFPTIYFVPSGQKDQPQRYEGGREVSDFIIFLKKEATNPLILDESRDEL
uniref:Protein disulfide-isomerase A3 n=1 Tax=Sinocyclocheilus anshuiensis TaxID=1608454 RepID=A0A671Q4B5_9TELE